MTILIEQVDFTWSMASPAAHIFLSQSNIKITLTDEGENIHCTFILKQQKQSTMKQASVFPSMGIKEYSHWPALIFTLLTVTTLLKKVVSRAMGQTSSYHFRPHLCCRERKYHLNPNSAVQTCFPHGSPQEHR